MIKIKKNIAIVTGGAGFIGSHLVDLLLKKKYEVRVIDNLLGGRVQNLEQNKDNKKLKFRKIDINRIFYKDEIFKNVKYIFHLAGIGDIVPSIENPSKYMFSNVQGTVNLLEAARFAKVKKFIYAASSSCYGICNKRTSENEKINPQYPYALSKNLGEQAVLNWHKVYNLPVNSIRIFNAYGPRVRTSGAYGAVFGVFFKQRLKNKPLTIIGNGNQKRDFIYVTDVAEAFLKAATTSHNGEIFNLGNDQTVTLSDMIKTIEEVLNQKAVIDQQSEQPGDVPQTWADIGKARKLLKYNPKTKFKDGIIKFKAS